MIIYWDNNNNSNRKRHEVGEGRIRKVLLEIEWNVKRSRSNETPEKPENFTKFQLPLEVKPRYQLKCSDYESTGVTGMSHEEGEPAGSAVNVAL